MHESFFFFFLRFRSLKSKCIWTWLQRLHSFCFQESNHLFSLFQSIRFQHSLLTLIAVVYHWNGNYSPNDIQISCLQRVFVVNDYQSLQNITLHNITYNITCTLIIHTKCNDTVSFCMIFLIILPKRIFSVRNYCQGLYQSLHIMWWISSAWLEQKNLITLGIAHY